jgi:REP element-mobilizing transposase RayT
MPQSHAQVWLHIVFSTKNRMPDLKENEFRDQMFRMLAHHVKETGCVVANVGGHVDHVHLLVGLSRTIKICKLIEVIKIETSKWAKKVDGGNSLFAWQAGYGVFSVSYSNLSSVENYIKDQKEHHAKRSYQDEFRLLCEKHGIEIDERYVWE